MSGNSYTTDGFWRDMMKKDDQQQEEAYLREMNRSQLIEHLRETKDELRLEQNHAEQGQTKPRKLKELLYFTSRISNQEFPI